VYWFTGASTQAVVTGAYRAVVFIKENIKLDADKASIEDSKEVVKICTVYAQKGMLNIFIVIFCLSLALPFFNPYFFIAYLIAMAFFGLFQAIFMANAGGAWDNAKKIVEVDMRMKGIAESCNQIHHPLWTSRSGDRGADEGSIDEDHHRRGVSRGGVVFHLPLLLWDADPGGEGMTPRPFPDRFRQISSRSSAVMACRKSAETRSLAI
jgi:hypothetical protein